MRVRVGELGTRNVRNDKTRAVSSGGATRATGEAQGRYIGTGPVIGEDETAGRRARARTAEAIERSEKPARAAQSFLKTWG